jgi:hypothetical protein
MKHALNYASYPTTGIEVGREVFANYINRHINRLIAANNPAYATIIAETKLHYDGMFGVISLREQNYNERIALTKNVKTIKKEFNSQIDLLEEAVAYKCRKNSAIYNEFFNHGVSPYKTATLAETVVQMELAESLATKYAVEIGNTFVQDLKTIRLKFEAEINSQQQTAGEVSSVIPDYNAKRQLIDKQLLKNICVIIIENLDNPQTVETFFDEHLIFPKVKKAEDSLAYILKIPALSKEVADISYSPDDTLLLTNNGTKSIFFYSAATADASEPTTLTEILPGDQMEITAIQLGAPANKFLIFVNKDATEEAEVEIALV